MYFACHNTIRQRGEPYREEKRFRRSHRVFCALLAAGTLLTAGCLREERDFRNGGPHQIRPSADLQSADPKDFSAARGPQISLEKNAFALSEGKRLYSSFNCIGCHANGGGDIGPALMDAKWLYGASPREIYISILEGRPNGMPAFRGRITDIQARQLAAYVRSLSGQANRNAATSRDDHMKTNSPENSTERKTPQPDSPKL